MHVVYFFLNRCTPRENFPRRISGNPGNFPSGKFPPENFGKSGKLPDGKISPGRILGNPGNFPTGKFHMVFYNIIYYIFRYKCSLNVCCEHIMCTNHKKFLPWEITCVFTKREETFSGESFPEISGENVAAVFPGKVFLQISHESITTQTL
jgi:hypothetical protein